MSLISIEQRIHDAIVCRDNLLDAGLFKDAHQLALEIKELKLLQYLQQHTILVK